MSNHWDWIHHIVGNEIASITKETTQQYTKWLASQRLEFLKIDPLYPEISSSPYKHLEAMADNNAKKTSFLESTVVNYPRSSSMNGTWNFQVVSESL